MKVALALILCVFMILGLCSCGGKDDVTKGGTTLKILAIGNSFSSDATNYLYDIAVAEGMTDVVIGNLFIGGCTLETHVNNISTNAKAYTYYKNDSGEWKTKSNCTLLYALQEEEWDIITMQQASDGSGLVDTYKDYVDSLITYVNENKTNQNAKFAWHMTWAYQSNSAHPSFPKYESDQSIMYQGIVNAVQTVIQPIKEISFIMPVGTAVQNARTSYFGDTLTRDGYHLNDMGRVIAAYTWYATFTDKPLKTLNFTEVSRTLTLTDSDKAVIIESVNNAIEQPSSITNSVYLTKPAS